MPSASLVIALVLAAQPAPVRGTVVDTAGRGVRDAIVVGVDGRGVEVARARTDSLGRFVVPIAADSVRLRVRAIGFEPVDGPMLPAAALRDVELELVPRRATLDAVIVRAGGVRAGFEARRDAARPGGRFLDSAAIAGSDAPSVRQLVDRVRFAAFGRRCVVIDGWYVGRVDYGESLNRPSAYDRASVGDLRAVEIYDDPMMIPTELSKRVSWPSGTPPCARVVFLWTAAAYR